jgi:TP901 family phage tail tape measure protein
MGFAGQVFAARVAIGLAVPSPKAMQEAGGILSTGAGGIFQKIALMRQQASAKNRGVAVAEQTKTNQIFQSNLKQSNNLMNAEIAKSLQNLSKSGRDIEGSFRKTGDRMGDSFAGLKKASKDTALGKDLFAGIQKGMKPLDRMTRMVQNLAKMDAQGRREVLRLQKEQEQASKDEFERLSKKDIRLRAQLKIEQDAGRAAGKTAVKLEKQIAANDKLIPKAEKRLRQEEKNTRNLKTGITTAEKYRNKFDEMARSAAKFGGKVAQVANHIRTGFNAALRNSVAIATAFYYKLNQNTQELIEFERELLNANSVFNLTNDELFKVGDTITQFGQKFGMEMQNGATGLYQLASAGVSANEALSILPHTLKLSMAVQGDHNTISKLTAQTLFGFGMEMDQAAEVTDKFAFAIQKSLIEYQDLSSAVKFALPFFTSTGQSIDQLLGALQILTNRALEAGIAGRGLRQALAEFAESAMDAEVGFRKMGVEILNQQGEMMQLTEIAAQFAAVVGPETASNTELLTTLIEDLNVRGATAFIHLVQASDEFTQAVEDTRNAGGQLDEMVRIQNESLSAQIQILKNNVQAIFFLRDASYEGTEFMNAFHEAVVNMVSTFRELIVTQENGTYVLTEFGQEIQDIAVNGVSVLTELMERLVEVVVDLTKNGLISTNMLELMVLPMKVMLEILNLLGASGIKFIIYFKLINTIVPLATLAINAYNAGLLKTLTLSRALIGLTGLGAALIAYSMYVGKQTKDNGYASGGYMHPMAGGGNVRGGPYLVGEQGPELFMPDSSGKILNTMQTQETIGSGKTVLRDVNIGIDSFGGLV